MRKIEWKMQLWGTIKAFTVTDHLNYYGYFFVVGAHVVSREEPADAKRILYSGHHRQILFNSPKRIIPYGVPNKLFLEHQPRSSK